MRGEVALRLWLNGFEAEFDMKFELDNVPARVIAHWTKASRQVLDDLPQLMGIIDTEPLDGLALKEDLQILSGDVAFERQALLSLPPSCH